METKILSLHESNKMIPLLKRIVQDIMEHWNLIIEKRGELETLEKTHHPENQPHIKEVKSELNRLIDKINQYIKEVEQLGCFVEEFKRGIVNFPSLYHGRKIFLCWQPEETAVSYWHELDETFNDRIKISDTNGFLVTKENISNTKAPE